MVQTRRSRRHASVPFLVRLAREVPLVRYFKIEVPGAAAKLRTLIEAGDDAIDGPFDGEESITLMADLDAGPPARCRARSSPT